MPSPVSKCVVDSCILAVITTSAALLVILVYNVLYCHTHRPMHSPLGQCYPCTQVVSVTCHCGHSSITVPCGRERRTKPPSCSLPCSRPPSCHHDQRPPHRCHFGDCSPCKEPCLLPLECSHNCRSVCHSEPITVSVVRP